MDEVRAQRVLLALKGEVQRVLEVLESEGVPAREADEFIREAVFQAWWDWDYGVAE